MKASHHPDIFIFSSFDGARDLDFNGYMIVRKTGNVLVDPVAMSDHDISHAERLGGIEWIVVTNSDHVRDSERLCRRFRAKLAGPSAERPGFPLACDRWLRGADDTIAGIEVTVMHGSKTPGELALIVDETTLVTGDLIRGQRGGSLNLLPAAKLADHGAAIASVRALAERQQIAAVLVGDGWPLFCDGAEQLRLLVLGR